MPPGSTFWLRAGTALKLPPDIPGASFWPGTGNESKLPPGTFLEPLFRLGLLGPVENTVNRGHAGEVQTTRQLKRENRKQDNDSNGTLAAHGIDSDTDVRSRQESMKYRNGEGAAMYVKKAEV